MRILYKNNKEDYAYGTIENRDTKNSTPILSFTVWNESIYPVESYAASYFDEYGCQGHSIIFSYYQDDTSEITSSEIYHIKDPYAIKSVSLPHGKIVTVYSKPNQ